MIRTRDKEKKNILPLKSMQSKEIFWGKSDEEVIVNTYYFLKSHPFFIMFQ